MGIGLNFLRNGAYDGSPPGVKNFFITEDLGNGFRNNTEWDGCRQLEDYGAEASRSTAFFRV